MQKLPPEAFSCDNFYVQPCLIVPDDPSKPWFTTNPIGKNTLSKMGKEMHLEGGLSGRKTNHSLRATGVSHLYHAGVPEKVIQERSWHLSVSGLHQYEHTILGQQQAVSLSSLIKRRHNIPKTAIVADQFMNNFSTASCTADELF